MDNIRTRSPSSDSFVEVKPKSVGRPRKHRLDNPASLKLFRDIKTWFDQESERQASNRYQMAIDEDYYDNLQWQEDEAEILIARGQAPVVYNEIKAAIDWMIGTERRARIDYKVLARRKEGTEDAENKTSLLKYLSDVNDSEFHRSTTFKDSIKAGMGVTEVGLRGDPTEEILFERYQDWRYTLYDSNSVEQDLSDARYFFRWKDLDEDIALLYFADRADVVRASVKNQGATDPTDWIQSHRTDPSEDWQPRTGRYQPYDGVPFTTSQRPIVRFVECWYRAPVLRKTFADGDLCGCKYDAQNQDHVAAASGGYGLYDRLEMEIRVVIYTSAGIVFEGTSPYRHNRIPFVVSWCYRRKRDNAPYGMIRALRDPQDGMNKRHSKAHWILSSNGIIMEKGAVDDIEEVREEVARPDYVIVTNTGKRFDINRDGALAVEHIQLMQQDAEFIRRIGGVNNENLGRQTNASSGVAIATRQDQGSVVTTEPFDNHRFAIQQIGEIELSMIEQFYSAEKTIRLLGGRGEDKFIELNTPDENGRIVNDITAMQSDFVISEQDYKSTMKQAMFESLFDIMGRMSQMGPDGLKAALNMLDLVVEMADLPNKDELVNRIREINGQKDPDAADDPEVQKAEAAATQQQVEVMDMQKQAAQANLMMLQAKVEQLVQQNKKVDVERLVKTVEAMQKAIEAGQIIAAMPGAAPVADELLRGAGYQNAANGQDLNINQPRQAQNIQQTQEEATEPPAESAFETPASELTEGR